MEGSMMPLNTKEHEYSLCMEWFFTREEAETYAISLAESICRFENIRAVGPIQIQEIPQHNILMYLVVVNVIAHEAFTEEACKDLINSFVICDLIKKLHNHKILEEQCKTA